MPAKHNNKGRSKVGTGFLQMNYYLVDSPAWRACSPYERALYLELKRRYNGRNNGAISFSHRQAQEALGCSNRPIMAAFKGLQEKGFIRPAQKGSFDWKAHVSGKSRATTWALTEYPVDCPENSRVPSKDFMRWRPD